MNLKKIITMSKTTHFQLLLFFIFAFTNLCAQSSDMLEVYETYTEAPREIAYVHLNKSTYIEGEMLGFSAYVFDKFTKQRSEMTTNLYCTISDEKGIIKQKKMIFLENGYASNVFIIDSSYTNGNYTFKAYTNWMKNFKEQNHYQQTFTVLDADLESEIKANKDDVLDIQLLGEGGHLLYDTVNSAGIIIKNKSGYGLPNAKGQIIDDNNNLITEFTLNEFGIGKILFKPQNKKEYYVTIIHNEDTKKVKITNIKSVGFVMALTETANNVAIQLNSNTDGFNVIKEKTYKLLIHNGNELKIIAFNFEKNQKNILIPKSELYSGINIFTITNNKNNPILERLFFNSKELKENTTSIISQKEEGDSLIIRLKINLQKPVQKEKQNISVSILPAITKSYNPINNIKSQLYLQPYIKGPVEKAYYYFQDMNRKKKYELDLLLLTQGWSSYDWSRIFSFEDNYIHPFERGIDVVTTINEKEKNGTYLVYPLKNNSSEIFSLEQNEKEFTQKRVIPFEDEKFRVSKTIPGSKQKKVALYPQFYPSQFATLNQSYNTLSPDISEYTITNDYSFSINSWNKVEELDEVVIEAKKKQEKLQSLKRKSNGASVKIIDNAEKTRGTPLAQIINNLGFKARFDLLNAEFTITNPRVNWGNPVPLVYLDNALLNDLNILQSINTQILDYIEVEKYGIGGGIRGNAGYIKIYTSPDFFYRRDGKSKVTSEFDFPLTFNENKTFYTPIYQFYNSTFFEDYGTIGWKPNITVDNNGEMTLKIFNPKTVDIKLFIEGVIDDALISTTHILKTKK